MVPPPSAKRTRRSYSGSRRHTNGSVKASRHSGENMRARRFGGASSPTKPISTFPPISLLPPAARYSGSAVAGRQNDPVRTALYVSVGVRTTSAVAAAAIVSLRRRRSNRAIATASAGRSVIRNDAATPANNPTSTPSRVRWSGSDRAILTLTSSSAHIAQQAPRTSQAAFAYAKNGVVSGNARLRSNAFWRVEASAGRGVASIAKSANRLMQASALATAHVSDARARAASGGDVTASDGRPEIGR